MDSIEPPTPGRCDRIVAAALRAAEESLTALPAVQHRGPARPLGLDAGPEEVAEIAGTSRSSTATGPCRRTDDTVFLYARSGRVVTQYWMDLAVAGMALRPGTVLDGEAVIWRDGRLDFAAAQSRAASSVTRARALAARHPASYVCWDVLQHPDPAIGDLRSRPYIERRTYLLELFADLGPPIQAVPATDDRELPGLGGILRGMRRMRGAGVAVAGIAAAVVLSGCGSGSGGGGGGDAKPASSPSTGSSAPASEPTVEEPEFPATPKGDITSWRLRRAGRSTACTRWRRSS
ncbi:hypothetical protein [Streptomyces sp. NPDC056304]|uniref:ATP-dependent DNA ligase n=1 Tax=Streptomyces sp. NPDC056304 TaxID=3345778 RepID=UPI0035DC6BD5